MAFAAFSCLYKVGNVLTAKFLNAESSEFLAASSKRSIVTFMNFYHKIKKEAVRSAPFDVLNGKIMTVLVFYNFLATY